MEALYYFYVLFYIKLPEWSVPMPEMHGGYCRNIVHTGILHTASAQTDTQEHICFKPKTIPFIKFPILMSVIL